MRIPLKCDSIKGKNNGGKVKRAFNYSEIRNQKWDSDILSLIAAIYKEAGKQEMYLKQRPEELEKLVEIAKIQRTEASNAIEGIVTTSTRIRQLVEEKTAPKNCDEQEIAGYRDVLNIIHENFDAIPISQRYILQLHKILYSHMNNPMAGKTKSVQNETPEALDKICEEYNRVIGNMEVEPLIVVPFIKYLLGIVLSAYKDFEERFALVETKRSALEMVRCATMNKLGRFTKQDIRELCPSLSISSIEGALRKLVASGELKREGVGKNICYYRLK